MTWLVGLLAGRMGAPLFLATLALALIGGGVLVAKSIEIRGLKADAQKERDAHDKTKADLAQARVNSATLEAALDRQGVALVAMAEEKAAAQRAMEDRLAKARAEGEEAEKRANKLAEKLRGQAPGADRTVVTPDVWSQL